MLKTAGQLPVGSNARSDHSLVTILIGCVATLGGFLFGFDSGVINGTVGGLQGAFDSDSVGTGFLSGEISPVKVDQVTSLPRGHLPHGCR